VATTFPADEVALHFFWEVWWCHSTFFFVCDSKWRIHV
jgi:hypothetical protein